MWTIIELILLLAIILVSITEFFWPLVTGKPILGSFRKSKTPEPEPERIADDTLDEKISRAKEQVGKIKKVQKEVNEKLKSARQQKNESDNLFK